MFVSSYQMQNVLNVYSRQLTKSSVGENRQTAAKKQLAGHIAQTAPGKRLSTMEKVSRDILSKITRYGSQGVVSRRDGNGTASETRNRTADPQSESKFVFNVIDGINTKKTSTLAVDDSSVLIQRLEQLSRQATGKKTDSWV